MGGSRLRNEFRLGHYFIEIDKFCEGGCGLVLLVYIHPTGYSLSVLVGYRCLKLHVAAPTPPLCNWIGVVWTSLALLGLFYLVHQSFSAVSFDWPSWLKLDFNRYLIIMKALIIKRENGKGRCADLCAGYCWSKRLCDAALLHAILTHASLIATEVQASVYLA